MLLCREKGVEALADGNDVISMIDSMDKQNEGIQDPGSIGGSGMTWEV